MAAGTPVYPGDYNSYVPSHESTQGLIVDFSRNPSDFALNQYCKLFPVDFETGLYARFGRDGGLPEEAARVLDTTLADVAWPDGNDAPDGNKFKELFQYVQYRTFRRANPWVIGDLTAAQSSWSLRDQYARAAAHLTMLQRTVQVVALATTSANYPTSHYSAVSSITGNTGKWDVSTTARQDIRRSLHTAVNQIRLDTLGVVGIKDLVLVMSPNCAALVARSQEIVDYLKQQAGSIKIITGKGGDGYNFVGDFELPEYLYGLKVVIEDSVKITNAKNDDTPFIASRPGALVGTDSRAPNFSTLSLFVWKENEMLVEEMHDDKHKRLEGRCIDNTVADMTAGAAGYLFTAAVG
jgi:hypothetical protein